MQISFIFHTWRLTGFGWQSFVFPVNLQLEENNCTDQDEQVDGQLHQHSQNTEQSLCAGWKAQAYTQIKAGIFTHWTLV